MNPISFMAGHWIIIGAVVGALAVGTAGGTYVTYKVMDDKLARIELADANTKADAIKIAGLQQKLSDAASQQAAVDHAKADQAIADKGKEIVRNVPVYVTKLQDAHNCVTWGLVRVHDAAALGYSDPSTLALPPGVTNDTCSPFMSSQLASRIAVNYTSALRNAKQLDDLNAYDAKLDQIDRNATAPPAKKSFFDRINPF